MLLNSSFTAKARTEPVEVTLRSLRELVKNFAFFALACPLQGIAVHFYEVQITYSPIRLIAIIKMMLIVRTV